MSSLKRLSLVALLLAALLATSTVVRCTEEKVLNSEPVLEETYDDFEGYEYLDQDESEIDAPLKPESIGNNYPPPSNYPAPVAENNNYPPPPPPPPPQQSYQAPPPPPPPVYQAPPVVEQVYQPPVPVYQPPVPAYQPPVYSPPVQNYSTPVYQQQQPYVAPVYNNYTQGVSIPLLINKYSLNDLIPYVALSSYRGNHWSLFYYRSNPYRTCPKGAYLSGPSYRDIELAFEWALKQLQVMLDINVNYLNSSQPTYAARHQVFSYLAQQNARMDEEGMLVELVSTYLSDRSCLTKWDKQRYLPQLTRSISTSNFPVSHTCSQYYSRGNWVNGQYNQQCVQSKYRTYDGFCNNPYHPYWGKSNVCHIRLLSPDYADGISAPRTSYNPRFPLPNARLVSNYIHNDIPLEGPYNLMKMQWGQFINHDISNTALSTYEGLVDCCRNPNVRGCWPIYVPPGDRFYGPLNVTCLNFVRSGICPLCQLGPRQQVNKNTAFLDASHVYGNTPEQAMRLRLYRGGLLKTSVARNGEILLPIANLAQDQCQGTCFMAGDTRVNQHPTLTVLHTLLLRRHNMHARGLALVHPNWNDEYLFQEARRITIAEYQMITYGEYFPIVMGPVLSAYFKLIPSRNSYTYYEPKADPTSWNEYTTATCRFGHSQIQSVMGLYSKVYGYGQDQRGQSTFRLKDWFMRPSFLYDGYTQQMVNGLLSRPAMAVDPWVTTDVRNYLYQSTREYSGGDLAATNIWRGRDHGLPGYVHYLEYCFNYKVRGWKDLALFIPYPTLSKLRYLYKVVENLDLWVGGMSERHFPGADTGPTFACVNGIQYYHLKFGDRFYFEHANQVGSFSPLQLEEIKRSTLARFICRTAYLPAVPQYAFLAASQYNPLINCTMTGEINYSLF